MFYVYIPEASPTQSRSTPDSLQTSTKRVREHDEGKSPHTRKFKLWDCVVMLRFIDEARARDFERYLKTVSGRGFL